MARRLWNLYGGEPWLDNPALYIGNRRRRRKKKKGKIVMARRKRDSKGRFLSRARGRKIGGRKRTKRKYSKARRGGYSKVIKLPRRSVALTNPRRRGRRRYRRNPNLLGMIGLNMPTLRTVGYTVLGVTGTPMVEGFANQFLPAQITANKLGSYAVKLASAWALSWGIGQFLGREAGRTVFIGGAAYIGLAAVQDFLPGVLGTAPVAQISGMGVQPLLGEYPSLGSYITAGAPERLQPEGRF